MTIKILFIATISGRFEVETRFGDLGPCYLASYAKKYFGKEDLEFKMVSSDVENAMREFKPDIVGIKAVSLHYPIARKHAEIVKSINKDIPVIMGGIHITLMPLSLDKNMDLAVIGEGERTFTELLNIYHKHRLFPKKELCKVNGVAYWDKDKIKVTAPRALIENLDEVPFPDRDLVKIEPLTYIFTSRGCPYKCTFCASTRFWTRVRFFSAKYVVSEIKFLYETYNVRQINIFDDLFIANKDRVREIVNLLEKEGLLGKIRFTCMCRANLIDDSILVLLKKMNVSTIGLGLESGSQKILNYLKCGTVTIEQNKNSIELIKKYNIEATASFIIGAPEETYDDVIETLNFIKKSKLDSFEIYVLTPYPGTPLWDYGKQHGLVSDDMDLSLLDQFFLHSPSTAIILSEKVSRKELINLYMMFERERKIRLLLRALRNLKNPGRIYRAGSRMLIEAFNGLKRKRGLHG